MPSDVPPPNAAARRPPRPIPLRPAAAVLLAISFSLCGGYLDLSLMLFKALCWGEEWFLRIGRDFAWTVPVSHAVLLLIPGIVIAAASRFRPGLVSMRAGSWLLATLAIWAALLRLPMYGVCSLILAAGLARPISDAVATRGSNPRTVRYTLLGLFGLLGVLAALSSGRQVLREHLARGRIAASHPRCPQRRADRLGHGPRFQPEPLRLSAEHHSQPGAVGATTASGITSPWRRPLGRTLHIAASSLANGRSKLNSQWKFSLDTANPTLAEYLAARGYQTAGFSANTNCCTYETGLARGFAHFEDFPLTPRSLLGRTVPGNWILMNILYRGHYHDMKWIGLQSRGAHRDQRSLPRLATPAGGRIVPSSRS